MPNDKKLVMCPDPECGKESPAESEECIGCGLPLKEFSIFDRMMSVRERIKAKEKPADPPKRRSIFAPRERK